MEINVSSCVHANPVFFKVKATNSCSYWLLVASCGCSWLLANPCGCSWLLVAAFWCLWLLFGACGCSLVLVAAFWCFWVIFGWMKLNITILHSWETFVEAIGLKAVIKYTIKLKICSRKSSLRKGSYCRRRHTQTITY